MCKWLRRKRPAHPHNETGQASFESHSSFDLADHTSPEDASPGDVDASPEGASESVAESPTGEVDPQRSRDASEAERGDRSRHARTGSATSTFNERMIQQVRNLAALLHDINSKDPHTPGVVAYLDAFADEREALPTDACDPLSHLADRFQLSSLECDLIALSALGECHEGVASTLRHLHPSAEPRISLGLACQLLASSAGGRDNVDAILHSGSLLASGIMRIEGPGARHERSLQLGDGLYGALNGIDASWPNALRVVSIPTRCAGLDDWLDLETTGQVIADLRSGDDRAIVVRSADCNVAMSRIAALSTKAGRIVCVRTRASDASAQRLAAAHASARNAHLALVLETDPASGDAVLDLSGVPGPLLVVVDERSMVLCDDRPLRLLPIGPISASARQAAWRSSLSVRDDEARPIAARYPVDPAFAALLADDLADCPIDAANITAAVRARLGLVLPTGCRLTSPTATWDRLVLPANADQLLREIVDRIEHQTTVLDDWGFLEGARASRGARLLFSGPPGTGKSLTAEVLAHRLGTDVLVVDLAQIVSKWLGETEKHLSAVFDAAERCQAVLLFDEADVLFTQRTSVSNANDRYANLETGYVLQRLDRFDGLAVLTTNLRQNIDRAFLRRMDAVIEFAVPDRGQRRDLWRVHLPAGAPLHDDVDLDSLATTFDVPGAWIRNAVIAAAFLGAASSEQTITQAHLRAALRREYQKASRPFPGAPEAA